MTLIQQETTPIMRFLELPPSNCSIYLNPSTSTFLVSLFITIGILISYIPQYRIIYQTRSSYGISPYFLLLNNISGFAAMANLILLSFISLPCCGIRGGLTGFECLNSQISLVQVGVQCFATFGITLCCLMFTDFERDDKEKSVYLGIVQSFKVILSFVVILILVLIVCYIIGSKQVVLAMAKFLGMFSTLTTILQYLPQLQTTYRLKKSGALSIKMMCIQFPGGLVWASTLILKPGADWSSWLPYLSAALIQGVLLVMSVYYDYFYDDEEGVSGTSTTDGQPLLRRDGDVNATIYT